MADVLPSCIGMEGLLYLLYSGFVQANKSHRTEVSISSPSSEGGGCFVAVIFVGIVYFIL